MKLLLLPSNHTALHGMTNFYLEAEKKGHVCTLLIEPKLSQCSMLNTIHLGIPDRQSSFSSLLILLELFPEMIKKYLGSIKRIIMNIFDSDNSKLIQKWISIQFQRELEIEGILDIDTPDIIFTYGDRHGGYEPALIKIANKNNIPVVIPPIAYPSEKSGLLVSIRKQIDHNSMICVTNNPKFKKKYPKQWIHDDITAEDFSFYPPWLVVAREQCDVLPDDPWILGGGKSTIICADGKEAKDRFIRNGVDSEKIRITGHPIHDSLYKVCQQKENKKNELFQRYGFKSGLPLLIIALPQTLEHNILSEKEHWQLQEHLCTEAVQTNWNILLSLHPKMDLTKYTYLEDKFDVKISKQELWEILALADLYLVGQGSSTVLWAVICEVPIVIADWYGLNYSIYDWIKGMEIVIKKDDLLDVLQGLTTSESTILETMRDSHRRQKHLVSPFDGECMDRILNPY